MAKALRLGRVTWFVAQVLGRMVQQLMISTLELLTISNACCALLGYLLWWRAPKNVLVVTTIHCHRSYE
jgi:hypothetical protein